MSTTDRPSPLLPTRMASERKPADSQHDAYVVYLILFILSIFSWISIGINASGGALAINPLTLSFADFNKIVDPISMSLDAAKLSVCFALGWLAAKRFKAAFAAGTMVFLLLFVIDLIVHIYVLASPGRWPSRWVRVWRESGSGWVIFLSVVYVLFRVYALIVLFMYARIL